MWADDLAFKIPPMKASFEVGGQKLALTTWGTIGSSGQEAYDISMTADLADVQKNAAPLLAAVLNRSEHCGDRMSIEDAALSPAPPAALMTAKFHYERWACAKMLGKQQAAKLVEGEGMVETLLTPSVGTDGIVLTSVVRKLEGDGSLGELLKDPTFGPAIKEKIAKGIQTAIGKGLDLQSMLPPRERAAITLRNTQFNDGGEGRLWFSVGGAIHLTAEQLAMLSQQLQH
jgi:hypothetical protein